MTGIEIDFVVPDCLKALELYRRIFDVQRIKVTNKKVGENEAVFTMYGTKFHTLDENFGFQLIAPKKDAPKSIWINVNVPDIEKTFRKAMDAGCFQVQPITKLETFGVSNAMFNDPFGHIWVLHQIHKDVSFEERCRIIDNMRHSEE